MAHVEIRTVRTNPHALTGWKVLTIVRHVPFSTSIAWEGSAERTRMPDFDPVMFKRPEWWR